MLCFQVFSRKAFALRTSPLNQCCCRVLSRTDNHFCFVTLLIMLERMVSIEAWNRGRYPAGRILITVEQFGHRYLRIKIPELDSSKYAVKKPCPQTLCALHLGHILGRGHGKFFFSRKIFLRLTATLIIIDLLFGAL